VLRMSRDCSCFSPAKCFTPALVNGLYCKRNKRLQLLQAGQLLQNPPSVTLVAADGQ